MKVGIASITTQQVADLILKPKTSKRGTVMLQGLTARDIDFGGAGTHRCQVKAWIWFKGSRALPQAERDALAAALTPMFLRQALPGVIELAPFVAGTGTVGVKWTATEAFQVQGREATAEVCLLVNGSKGWAA